MLLECSGNARATDRRHPHRRPRRTRVLIGMGGDERAPFRCPTSRIASSSSPERSATPTPGLRPSPWWLPGEWTWTRWSPVTTAWTKSSRRSPRHGGPLDDQADRAARSLSSVSDVPGSDRRLMIDPRHLRCGPRCRSTGDGRDVTEAARGITDTVTGAVVILLAPPGHDRELDISDADVRLLLELDVKLLIALNALLEERSVTRTSAALGVSKSAVSAALAKLRQHFGDELLQRRGNHFKLTERAEALHIGAVDALQEAAHLFGCPKPSEPGSGRHHFSDLVPYYAAAKYRRLLMSDGGPALVRVDSGCPEARVLQGLSTTLTRRPGASTGSPPCTSARRSDPLGSMTATQGRTPVRPWPCLVAPAMSRQLHTEPAARHLLAGLVVRPSRRADEPTGRRTGKTACSVRSRQRCEPVERNISVTTVTCEKFACLTGPTSQRCLSVWQSTRERAGWS